MSKKWTHTGTITLPDNTEKTVRLRYAPFLVVDEHNHVFIVNDGDIYWGRGRRQDLPYLDATTVRPIPEEAVA